MYLADYHMHSICSMDGNNPLTDMAAAAVAAGMKEICLTDHGDMLNIKGEEHFYYDWAPVYEQLAEARATFDGRLVIKMGLEFGSGFLSPADAAHILSAEGLDFVIGSVHNKSVARGGGDFYYEQYEDAAHVQMLLGDYVESLEQVARSPYYDVIGHVPYLLRYVPQRAGFPSDMTPWWEQVRCILKDAVAQGKGIEVNTHCGRAIALWRPILLEYRALGGEVLTFGSDAHHPENVGKGIQEGQALAKACGFRAFCTYEKRKPLFHDL